MRDEGDLFPVPGDSMRTIERGMMVNPATGDESEYEEGWVDEEARGAKVVAMVLEEAGGRGMVIRVGGWCQGFVKWHEEGREVEMVVERWREVEGRWERVVRLGNSFLPCAVAWSGGVTLGGKIKYKGTEWEVVEVSGG